MGEVHRVELEKLVVSRLHFDSVPIEHRPQPSASIFAQDSVRKKSRRMSSTDGVVPNLEQARDPLCGQRFRMSMRGQNVAVKHGPRHGLRSSAGVVGEQTIKVVPGRLRSSNGRLGQPFLEEASTLIYVGGQSGGSRQTGEYNEKDTENHGARPRVHHRK